MDPDQIFSQLQQEFPTTHYTEPVIQNICPLEVVLEHNMEQF